jgi:hypothetical protein
MKVSAARKQTFVEALVRGAAPEAAAKMISVDRATAYRWRAADESFAAEWQAATDRKVEAVETVLYRMAMEKDLGAICFFLKAHKPELYNRKTITLAGDPANPLSVTHHGGEEVVHLFMPPNGRDQPEPEEALDEPPTIDGEASEAGNKDAA